MNDELRKAEELPGPVFYLGDEYEGNALRDVMNGPQDGYLGRVDFVYGDCEIEADAEMCPVPLEVRNAVCREGTRIAIWSVDVDRREAAKHLRPIYGGGARPYEVVFERDPLCGT